MKSIYQLYIELQDLEPAVWRRIQVPAEMELADLHKVLQVVMGWTNSHLHQFIKTNVFYSPRTEGDEEFWDEAMNKDYTGVTIGDLLKEKQDMIDYEYDYGDSWIHTVLLEDILEKDVYPMYPLCLGGERHCPPEDCGGVWGYVDILNVLKNIKHPEYKHYKAWLGNKFNPDKFELDDINKSLRLPDYGLPKWEDFD